MGKCKKRTFAKSVLNTNLKREEVIKQIIYEIRKKKFDNETKKILTLFGITAEELTEAGITYEEILLLKEHL